MKKLAVLFEWIGFAIQYLVPLFLFSDVIPFVVENPDKSVTVVGYICLGIGALFLWKKIKQKIYELPRAWWRALILSIPPIVTWLIVWICLGTVSDFLIKLGMYWDDILLYIVIGRVFAVVSETLYNIEPSEKNPGKKRKEGEGDIDG